MHHPEQNSETDVAFDQRLGLRHPVLISVKGRSASDSRSIEGHLLDLSVGGFLIETSAEMAVGKTISIDLPEVTDLSARVVWANRPLYGCELDRPLAKLIVERTWLNNAPATADDTPVAIGQHVKKLRQTKGWTRAELAEIAGVSRPSVWGWETGRTEPRLDALRRLATAFGCSVAELRNPSIARFETPGSSRSVVPDEPLPTVDAILTRARHDLAARLDIPTARIRLFFEVIERE